MFILPELRRRLVSLLGPAWWALGAVRALSPVSVQHMGVRMNT